MRANTGAIIPEKTAPIPSSSIPTLRCMLMKTELPRGLPNSGLWVGRT